MIDKYKTNVDLVGKDNSLHKKWNFPLTIFSVNVTKSAVSCGFGHIYWRNHWRKSSFFAHWLGNKAQSKLGKRQHWI